MKATGQHWVALDEATFRMGNGRGDGYPDDGELPVPDAAHERRPGDSEHSFRFPLRKERLRFSQIGSH